MKEEVNNEYIRCKSCDYSMAFKLHLVEEIEQGYISQSTPQHKYGIQGDGAHPEQYITPISLSFEQRKTTIPFSVSLKLLCFKKYNS